MDPSSPASVAAAPAPEGTSLVQILIILRRRWRLLAIVWVATLAAAAVYTFTSTKLYRPQSTLEIRPEMPLVSSESSDANPQASVYMWDNYFRTQESILTSPTLIEATLHALPEAIRKEYEGLPDPVRAFTARLDIEKIRSSFILKVGFVDKSAENATQVVNTLVSLYLENANRRLRDLKSGAVEVLSKEALPSIRAKVDEADRKIQEFQKAAGFMDFEEHYKLLIEKYRKYDLALTDLGLKRRKIRAELEALGSYGAGGVSGLFNPAFHSTRSLEPLADQRSKIGAELARQEKLLKEKHPLVLELRAEMQLVDEKIREAVQGTLKALESDLAEVEAEEKGIKEDLEAVSRQVEEVGGQRWTFKQLDGELTSAKELYTTYLRKHGETTATSGSTLGSVRVIDHATVPLVPFKPHVLTNLALAALVGLLLGFGAMFVTEQLDDRIASPREVEAFVGLDVLALIPRLGGAGKAGSDPVLLGTDSSLPELETFRGLRAEVLTRLEKLPNAKVLAVVSALQSEGKSTVTANLAAVLAMEGRRVLIVDADLRRPSMLALVGKSDGPGILQVLKGEIPPERAIQKSRVAGVDVLGSKEGMSSAAELAGGPRVEEVLQYAREHYDFVLIDSAPVNQVSESALVARRADATILVIRELQTGRGAALMANRRLKGMGVIVLGAVLNCARPQGGAYGYYYAYERA
jgi:succinoglycan biosynthesis transport protein ExoP